VRFSHVGICVTDVESSLRFYRDFLGFQPVHELEIQGKPTARLLRLEKVELRALFLERDGVRIELLHYATPGHIGEPAPRAMNRIGLTHLSIQVEDIDEALAGVEPAGGRVLKETIVSVEQTGARAAFLTDPDGTLIELVQWPTPTA
jgi:catechol 2,3-dioxygenase-like lactoylglutathione lyase family enzyme